MVKKSRKKLTTWDRSEKKDWTTAEWWKPDVKLALGGDKANITHNWMAKGKEKEMKVQLSGEKKPSRGGLRQ